MSRHLTQTSQHLESRLNGQAPVLPARSATDGLRKSLSRALLGLALIVGAPAVTLAGGGEGVQAGQPADMGYADRIAPLRAAAKNNDVRAQETLGFIYLCPGSRCAPGIARDVDEARYWLSRAAAQGSALAARQLAWLRGESRPTVAATID